MSDANRLVVGTRGSQLARAQTGWVVDRIREANPGLEVHTEIITTKGDRQQDRPLPEIGGKGLFTAELEEALMAGGIDLAVHSAKDLPTELAEGLDVLAWPAREDPRDAWVSADGKPFDELPEGAVVGTTSLRRQSQLLMTRPDLTFVGLRGNIDTRIKKVHRGDCAGALLAMAGLIRANLAEHVTHPFEPEICLPAPGQGALALQGRTGDEQVIELLKPVHDPDTATAVACERAILHELDAGCRAPVAVLAQVAGIELHCEALVSSPDGKQSVAAELTGKPDDVMDVAAEIVGRLRDGGATEIIAECRKELGL
jgi:hydroxymethylbilane synthase